MPDPVRHQDVRTTRTIDQLCLSPLNVRTSRTATCPEAIAIMEGLLMSQGQQQPILCHPLKGNTKKEGVHAGGRRYRAFKNLVARGDLPPDHPIEVKIQIGRTDAELLGASMVENIGREDLEDYETFDGVRRMHAAGSSVATIAEVLARDQVAIHRMLRLGNLPEPIFKALAAGRISTEQARAFGAIDDQAAQIAAWERLSAGLQHFAVPAEKIRAALGIGNQDLEKLLTFVGEAAYRAAGGRLEPDLFAADEQPRAAISDPQILRDVADTMLDALRGDIRRLTGRPDLRFVAEMPKDRDGHTDWQLRVAVAQSIPVKLPDGDIVARVYINPEGRADTDYWWASRSAKYAGQRGTAAALEASPRAIDATMRGGALAPAVAIGQQYDNARQVADAAIRAGRPPVPAQSWRRGPIVEPTAAPAAASAPAPPPAAQPRPQPRVRTFEEQLAAVAAGARLVEVRPLPARPVTMTLGGVASGLLA